MLATVGLLASGAGPAGAHGGDTSKIHSCIVPSSGYAQIIGANETCSKNYRALDWSAADTNTTYDAGFGLSLSSANVFSVTGAPWSGLTGVPAGFADGVDNVGSTTWSTLTGVPAGFADNVDDEGSNAWGDLTGVPSGFADDVDDAGSMKWSDLTGVPLDFADGDDDDGSAGLGQLVSRLADADGTPNESSDPVSFTKLKDLTSASGDGRILGSFIQDGTIQGADVADNAIGSSKLAGTYTDGTESTAGAVTSAKIRDGAIEGRDLGTVVQNVSTSAGMGTLPAGSRSAIAISVPGVRTSDLVTVSPPATLDDDLIFSGSDVLADGVVTVYLYNPTANAIDGGFQPWRIRYLNTDG